MSSYARFFVVLTVAVLLAGLCVAVWRLGRHLRQLGDRRHELRDPSGRLWATRLHWGRPGAGFGLGSRLFPRRRPAAVDRPTEATRAREPVPTTVSTESSGLPVWLEAPLGVLELFDPTFLIGALLGAVAVVVLAGVLAVVLAVELLIVLVVAVGYTVARGFFGHPWVIEIDPPWGEPSFLPVRGVRAASQEHRRIRTLIELGRYELDRGGLSGSGPGPC